MGRLCSSASCLEGFPRARKTGGGEWERLAAASAIALPLPMERRVVKSPYPIRPRPDSEEDTGPIGLTRLDSEERFAFESHCRTLLCAAKRLQLFLETRS